MLKSSGFWRFSIARRIWPKISKRMWSIISSICLVIVGLWHVCHLFLLLSLSRRICIPLFLRPIEINRLWRYRWMTKRMNRWMTKQMDEVWTPCLMHWCVCIWWYILQNYNYKLHFQNLFIYNILHVSMGTSPLKILMFALLGTPEIATYSWPWE